MMAATMQGKFSATDETQKDTHFLTEGNRGNREREFYRRLRAEHAEREKGKARHELHELA